MSEEFGVGMVDEQLLLHISSRYAATTLGSYDIAQVLHELVDEVVAAVGVDAAGVVIADQGGPLLPVAASDQSVIEAVQAQVEHREGPSHEAFTTGRICSSADLSTDTRWPLYRPRTLQAGWQAVAGIPMQISDGERIGALNRYCHSPTAWNQKVLDAANLLADLATGYIVNSRLLHDSQQLNAQLQHALDSRVIIEQAKGILASQHGLNMNDAFHRLRKTARSNHLRLRDLAQRIVDEHDQAN